MPDMISPDMIGRVNVNVDVDTVTVSADVTHNGRTVTVTFEDEDVIEAVTDAISDHPVERMREAAANAICNNYEAECHMYQMVF